MTNETLQHIHLGVAWALSVLALSMIIRVLAECIKLVWRGGEHGQSD